MIKPTVGRVVHFYPAKAKSILAADDIVSLPGQPVPALVCAVWSDTCINIAGFDANGNPFKKTCVLLVQADSPIPDSEYAAWMPYQVQQAAKESSVAKAAEPLDVEKEIAKKGLNAPRVTPAMIDAAVASEAYYVFPGTTLTICALTLKNGFTVTGESACASPENFDKELGEQIARKQAKEKLWALEGYALRNQLSAQ